MVSAQADPWHGSTTATGDWAEASRVRAAPARRAAGWTILARNVRVGRSEVDIVARDPEATLVFVEVRSRSGSAARGAGGIGRRGQGRAALRSGLAAGAERAPADGRRRSGKGLPRRPRDGRARRGRRLAAAWAPARPRSAVRLRPAAVHLGPASFGARIGEDGSHGVGIVPARAAPWTDLRCRRGRSGRPC